MKDKDIITLAHGSGGKLTNQLIKEVFLAKFSNPHLTPLGDSAYIDINNTKLSFTTDSFVVDPLFFPGGDIGKLAVCGTVNDLAVSGAKPLYISCSLIIEEGLEQKILSKIVNSMQKEAKSAGVEIVTGDTKVVEKGKGDKIFINTSGIGLVYPNVKLDTSLIKPTDVVIINGTIADHGISVISAREDLKIKTPVYSDCASLNDLILGLLNEYPEIKFMRDPTRGGLATVLNEIANQSNLTVEIEEDKIPIKEEVSAVCELLGFDPLYIANEGKVVIVAPESKAEKILEKMKKHPKGKNGQIIGKITDNDSRRVWLKTCVGGKRIVDMMIADQLPRIC